MTGQSPNTTAWTGATLIDFGVGAFLGAAGDNKPHKHWAHQIVIGLNKNVELHSHSSVLQGHGFWIDAGTIHQLSEAQVLCLYLDPTHALANALSKAKSNRQESISQISPTLSQLCLKCLSTSNSLSNLLIELKKQYDQSTEIPPTKLNAVLDTLHNAAKTGSDVSRDDLAKQAHLSPSRFSHWFCEQTGMPLRSYKKWLRMLLGFELAADMSLTEAAVAAGFSDQAHFCRTVDQAFGVNPVVIQRLLHQT